MEEHYLVPKGANEIGLVADRILGLSSTVLSPQDWTNLLSAAESILPKKNGERVPPSELDLVRLRSQVQMSLFAAILQAVGSDKTYKTNRRYALGHWTTIVVKFAELSLYVLPPARLDYAVELCLAAIDPKTPIMESIALIDALSQVDLRVVAQLVSSSKIDEYSVALVNRLTEFCENGENIDRNSDGEYSPDDYGEWLSDSQAFDEVVTAFSGWSGRNEPEELLKLRHLILTVDRPADPDPVPNDERSYSRSPAPSSYWTLERIFEDL